MGAGTVLKAGNTNNKKKKNQAKISALEDETGNKQDKYGNYMSYMSW